MSIRSDHTRDLPCRGEAKPRKDRHVPRGYAPARSVVERDAFRPPPTDTFTWEELCCRTCLAHGRRVQHRNGLCPRVGKRERVSGDVADPQVVAALLAIRERARP